jgi:hypothetical protein
MTSTNFQNLLQDKLQLLFEGSSCKIAIYVEKEGNLTIASVGLNSILNSCDETEKIKFMVGLFELVLELYDNPDANNSQSPLHRLIGHLKPLSFECRPFISYHKTASASDLYNHFRVYIKLPDNSGFVKNNTIFHIEADNDLLAKLFAELKSKHRVFQPSWNQKLDFWEFPENLTDLLK